MTYFDFELIEPCDHKNYHTERNEPTCTEEGLEKRNIKIFYDQNHILDDDLIVTYSAAFSDEHAEIKRIKEKGLKVVSYNELLGNITNMFETTCVAGTHGKTTTSLLISHILSISPIITIQQKICQIQSM